MKTPYLFFIILLAACSVRADDAASSPALRGIDAQIAAEQAKGDKADPNIIAWLQAKRQQLLPPGPSADELYAERQRAEQEEQQRWQQQLQAGEEFTRELARDNAASEAALSRNYAARQQQETNALTSPQYSNSPWYMSGYPYYWSYGYARPGPHPPHHGPPHGGPPKPGPPGMRPFR